MVQKNLKATEVIFQDDRIYHLGTRRSEIADTVITVGDPSRVAMVSNHFDKIEHQIIHREFVTHTGYYKGTRLTVMSTGIGPDNIDIALNELNILNQYNLPALTPRKDSEKLNIIRLGTTGGFQEDIPVHTVIVSEYGIGMDGLLHFYDYNSTDSVDLMQMEQALFLFQSKENFPVVPYVSKRGERFHSFPQSWARGITLTAAGFYAPQGRVITEKEISPDWLFNLRGFRYRDLRISNIEMETAAIYGLGNLFKMNSLSVSLVLANRYTGEFSQNPSKMMTEFIPEFLEWVILQN